MSGGSANTSEANSTGGAISTAAGGEILDNIMNNLFPNVSGPDATSGSTRYRCGYIKNTNGTKTFTGVKMWISHLTDSPHDEVDINFDPAAPGSTASGSSNGTTDPGVVTWRRPLSESDATSLGVTSADIGPGQQKAFWVKQTVQAGAAAYASNMYELSVSGETT